MGVLSEGGQANQVLVLMPVSHFRTLSAGSLSQWEWECIMSRMARTLLVVVALATACGDLGGGSDALSDEWLAFDPCELGDPAAAASLLGVKEVTTEVIETFSMFGDDDAITGKTCVLDAGGIGSSVMIWFGEGDSDLERGGRLVDLPGVGDKAGMTVNDGEHSPEREGEILGIVVNVAGMSLIISPPSGETPREGSSGADQLVEISRVAADRMRVAATSG